MRTGVLLLTMAILLPAQTAPVLTANPAALTFSYQLGAAALPAPQTVQIASVPAGQNFTVAVSGSPFNAAWLLVSASTGKTPLSLRVQVNPTGLAAGSFAGTITVTGTTGSPPPAATIAVTLQVSAAAPTLTASPMTLNFSYTTGQPVTAPSLTAPLLLSSSGAALQATIAVQGATWLKVTPTGNISVVGLLNTLSVTVDPTGLAPRAYSATIRVTAPQAANRTLNIGVNLTVNAAPPMVTGVWPGGAIQGSAPIVATLTGQGFFSNSAVTATGFTQAATVTVTSGAATASETLWIPVYPAIATHLRFTMASPLPAGNAGSAYSQPLSAAGGTPPYAFSAAGTVPPGLSINGNTIAGTPATAGTYSFVLTVSDSSTPSPLFAYLPMRMTVYPSGASNLRITVAAAPLPSGAAGAAYGPIALSAAGITGPPAWSASALPAGMTLTGAGSLAGTPAAEGMTGPLAATVVSDQAMLVTVPAPMLATEGILRLGVTTPAPGGGTSNEAHLNVFGPGPQITAVVNSASFRQGSVSPGEIITIFGLGLGPATLSIFDPTTPPIPAALPASAPSTSVTINGTPAPVLYTSATQAAVIVPYSISGPTAQIVVSYGTLSSTPVTVAVAPANPGIYTISASGSGQGAILNFNAATNDYTINGQSSPAARGSTVVLYLTGAGAMSSAISNQLIPASPAVTPTAGLTVTLGGQAATIAGAQAPPGSVPGLLQINVVVPNNVQPGTAVPVVVTIGGVESQPGVTMAVR
ncbi:MAG: IPT/TIG domain-containing protein [Bryobacteraceae bacterium]|nr:IPT/TIG domain-containing protein [Bryobacteraceae bacterium]